jgi:hypothetical protein
VKQSSAYLKENKIWIALAALALSQRVVPRDDVKIVIPMQMGIHSYFLNEFEEFVGCANFC